MDYITFFELANKLKKTKRSGWLDRNIPNAESVADHSWRVALMAMVFSKKIGIDSEKAVKMALVHDLAEAITGDISADSIMEYEGYANSTGIKPSMTEKQKHALEKKALLQMAKSLDEKSRKEILSLWNAFEERNSKTAKFVKELDRIDTVMQALEYKREHPENEKLRDFFLWQEKFSATKSPLLKKIEKQTIGRFEKIDKGK